jgi:hypothetical protein
MVTKSKTRNELSDAMTHTASDAGHPERRISQICYFLAAYFPDTFRKKIYAYKITMLSLCLCILSINFLMSEPIFMKLGMYGT